MRKIALFFIVGIMALASAGCGLLSDKADEPYNDAPRVGHENDAGARVIMFPDGFSNAATKCDHGNRVYVIYKGDDNRGAISVVPHDPTCDVDNSTGDNNDPDHG